METLRILYQADQFSPCVGGVEAVGWNLTRCWKALGHEVTILASRNPPSLQKHELINGIPVKRLYYPLPRLKLKHAVFPAIAPLTLADTVQTIKEFKPDVVSQQLILAPAFYLLFAKKIVDFKWVLTCQGTDVENFPEMFKANKWFVTKALEQADYITSSSQRGLNCANQLYEGTQKKSKVIHNGIELYDFERYSDKFQHPKPYIFAIARFVKKKGMDLLIDAYSVIAKAYDVDLIIAGYGEEEVNLRNQIAKLKLEKRVTMIDGRVDRKIIIELLNGCLFGVCPSRLEVFGMNALEPMAAGKPCLATNVGGLPEVTGGYAWLVEPARVSLVKGMMELLDHINDEEVIKKAKAGKEFVFKNYSWENIAREYVELFKQVA